MQNYYQQVEKLKINNPTPNQIQAFKDWQEKTWSELDKLDKWDKYDWYAVLQCGMNWDPNKKEWKSSKEHNKRIGFDTRAPKELGDNLVDIYKRKEKQNKLKAEKQAMSTTDRLKEKSKILIGFIFFIPALLISSVYSLFKKSGKEEMENKKRN